MLGGNGAYVVARLAHLYGGAAELGPIRRSSLKGSAAAAPLYRLPA
jgi:hypothetical protein